MNLPLAEKMRPTKLSEVIGQEHLTDEGQILAKIIAAKKPRSLIFWGPPGTGKTTLARILANKFQAEFVELSAVTSGKKDVALVVEQARQNQTFGKATILFVDEIHRFNKAQQDAFLPHVESGLITLIGATTENPSFEVISPLLSRVQVLALKPITKSDIVKLLKRSIKKLELNKTVTPAALNYIAEAGAGDARKALGYLELALDLSPKINLEAAKQAVSSPTLIRYDKQADNHYDLASAFIKSMRGSDVDATTYYLARMLQAGEDPLFIARRMVIFASEDIGLAGNGALGLATACFDAVKSIGMPEAKIPLFHVAIALAKSHKSRTAYDAIYLAEDAVKAAPNATIPVHLRNPSTNLMKELGYGQDYHWQADFKHAKGFLPEGVDKFIPTDHFKKH